ncbi:hypothetical protein ACWC2K_38885 [Streptomyces chattanoogensis]
MEILSGVFSVIDADMEPRWAAIGMKIAVAAFILGVLLEFARFLAIRFWSRVSTRVERRQGVERAISSARKIGVRVGEPGWRKKMPRSIRDLVNKTPARIFHYVKAKRLTSQISSGRLERMAKRRSSLEVLAEFPMRAVRLVARRSVILLASGVAVYEQELPGEMWSDLGRIVDKAPLLAEQRTWIPVLVLGVGVLAVARASPLIDGVRARDEAAKDTNRLLTELLAKISELDIALWEVHEGIASYRRAYLDEVSSAEKLGWEWSPQVGFHGKGHRFRLVGVYGEKSLEGLTGGEEFQRVRRALGSVGEQLEVIRDKGLSSVAIRILSPVSSVFKGCGFRWHLHHSRNYDLGVTRSIMGLSWMERRAASKERILGGRFGECDDKDALDVRLLGESYRFDDLLLRSKLDHIRLQRVQRFLVKRVHGTTLTRLIGAAGHK